MDLPKKGENNLWYRRSLDAGTVIVFVHGVLSDSRSCWLHEPRGGSASYWPALIGSDTRFRDPSIYLAGYHTAIDSGDYPIQDCAGQVLSHLKIPDVDGWPPVLEHERIVFVCHSMGGIVVRYLLCEERETFREKRIGLFLVASPSFGSKLASALDSVIDLYNHAQGAQLRWRGEMLRDLDRRFRDTLPKMPNLAGREVYENRFRIHWKYLPLFSRTRVVAEDSAARYFAEARQIPASDHNSICKPADARSLVHQYLLEFLVKHDLLPAPPAADVPSASAAPAVPSPTAVPAPDAPAISPYEWHPPQDGANRGPLTPGTFEINPSYQSDGEARWSKWGDVMVWLKQPPNADDVYLVPSRRAPRRFWDKDVLLEQAEARASKRRLTAEFVKDSLGRPLAGYWFFKKMSDQKERVHVYSSDYDAFLTARASQGEARRDLVYISYARVDDEWRTLLRATLDRDPRLKVWDDRDLPAGDWQTHLIAARDRARVMVMLVTPAYLASATIAEWELRPAVREAKEGRLALVWIPVKDSAWASSPLALFTAAIAPEPSLESMDDAARGRALQAVYLRICDSMGLDALPRTIEAADPVASSPVIRAVTSSSDGSALARSLRSPDPSVSLPAAKRLAAAEDVPWAVLAEAMGSYPATAEYALRLVAAAHPKASGAMLFERVSAAESDLYGALQAARCLVPGHGSYCGDRLVDLLKRGQEQDSVDIQHACVVALGRLGDASYVHILEEAGGIRDVRSPDDRLSYPYEKLGEPVTESLAWLFVIAGQRELNEPVHLRPILGSLERALRAAEILAGDTVERDFEIIFHRCRPAHADLLLEAGLSSSCETLTLLSVYALGAMRLTRALDRLSQIETTAGQPRNVVGRARWAAAEIRGGDAAFWLGMAEPVFAKEVRDRLEGRAGGIRLNLPMLRAIGLRKDTRFAQDLRGLLGHADGDVRGRASLALAQTAGRSAMDALRVAHRDAATPLERVLTGLAALVVSGPSERTVLVAQIAVALAAEQRLYELSIAQDIIAVLRGADMPEAARLADAWEEIYADGGGWHPLALAAPVADRAGSTSPPAPSAVAPRAASSGAAAGKDFFISYTAVDRAWAEWIGWVLEEAGYSVVLQAWDFRPGSNFVLEMQKATTKTRRTIAVLSEAYLESAFTGPEWASAFGADPTSEQGKLVPVRVGPCHPPGLLSAVVYVDLVGIGETAARAALLAAFRERAKPAQPPRFPTAPAPPRERSGPKPYPGAAGPL